MLRKNGIKFLNKADCSLISAIAKKYKKYSTLRRSNKRQILTENS